MRIRLPRPVLLACCLVGLALPASLRAAPCPPPARGSVVEQESLPEGALVRVVAGPRLAPYLDILDRACRPAARLGTTGGVSADATSVLRFRVMRSAGLPQPLIVVVAASPGGSDTSFSTQLIAVRHGTYQALLARPVTSLLDGGVFVGPLGDGFGAGIAVWDFVWARSEAHVSPHRYRLQRERWDGARFRLLPVLTTKGRYTRPEPALAELGVHYEDLTRTMPGFEALR